MKVYSQYNMWGGSIVVIAENEEHARGLMQKSRSYDSKGNVKEFDLKPGVVLEIAPDDWRGD